MQLSTKTGRILLGAAIGVLCLALLLCGFLFLNRNQGEPSLEQNGGQQTTVDPNPDDDDVIINDDPSPTHPAVTEPEATEPEATEPEQSVKPTPKPEGIQVLGKVNSENNIVTEAVTFSKNGVSVTVPAGTLLEDGVTQLKLTIKEKQKSDSGVALERGHSLLPLDVHISGISKENTTPIIICLGNVLDKALNFGNVTLYHVENGVAVPMNQVATVKELNAHNAFHYDPVTGGTTVAMATFSELALVSEAAKWEGQVDFSWYDPDVTELTIANADQLWAFSQIVGGMAEDYPIDDFMGKTVKLIADIDLNDLDSEDGRVFYPIGYHNSTGAYTKQSGISVTSSVSSFSGVFDGQGHTIKNFYQNTWEMFGDYNSGYAGKPNHYKDAMGLFGYVVGGDSEDATSHTATIKNLTIENFSSDGEFTPTGVIAAYAKGKVVFENIALVNCNPRVYNTGNGGIVGWDDGGDAENDPNENSHYTFRNITLDNTNKISALWGSWDVACGGLMGYKAPYTQVHMENCHVAAQIDVFNDVCGNYQYYWYRYAGMLIGTIDRHTTDADGYTVPDVSGITATGCTVHFGNWNDYYYCELVANSLASYTHDHQFSRLDIISSLDEIKSGDTWTKAGNFLLIEGNTKTCYHIVSKNGVLTQHHHEDSGTEVVGGETVLKENNQIVYLPFNQLFTGYGWGVKNIPIYSDNVTQNPFPGVTVLGIGSADSVDKFQWNKPDYSFLGGVTVTVGELFQAKDSIPTALAIDTDNVQVFVSPVGNSSTAGCIYTPDTSDWTKGKITFTGTGAAKITISDYYYCNPLVLNITLKPHECALHTDAKWQPLTAAVYTGHTSDSMDGYRDENNLPTQTEYDANVINSGFYYLAEDVSLDRIIDQRAAADITICLNGHTLTGVNIEGEGNGQRGRIFRLVNGSKVTVCDCSAEHTGTLAAGDTHTDGAVVYLRGTSAENAVSFTMENGIIDGNKFSVTNRGGLIFAENYATVNLTGATLQNGQATKDGGAIYASKGAAINLEDTTIQNCTAGITGGAISTSSSPVSIIGGSIQNCSATSNGGALCILGRGSKGNTLAGGVTISACESGSNGGAVYINTADMTIDGATITGNTAASKGGAIFLSGSDTAVTMHSGSITGNTSHIDAAVCVSMTNTFIMNDGSITGNINQTTNVVGVNAVGTFIMNNGQISGNMGPYYEGTTTPSTYWGEVVATHAKANVQIKGGTITPHEHGAYALRCFKGTMDVTGGQANGAARFDAGDITVSGGYIQSVIDANKELYATTVGGSMTVSGGSFGTNTVLEYLVKNLTLSKHQDAEIYDVVVCKNHSFTNDAVLCDYGCKNVNTLYLDSTALTHIKINNSYQTLDPDTHDHTVYVGGGSTIEVALITLNPEATSNISGTLDISGATEFKAIITAQDGSTTKEHTFTLVRDHSYCTICPDDGIEWQELTNDAFINKVNGYYYLNGDYTMPDVLNLSEGADITICLNGHKLTGDTDARMFRVADGAKLTILDCSGQGILKPMFSFDGAVAYVGGGNTCFTMDGCTVDCSSVTANADGVSDGVGGAIEADSGATVVISNSVFNNAKSTAYGGALSLNNLNSVQLSNVTFNNCASNIGGAIRMANTQTASFIVDCTFNNCSATSLGGGVYLAGGSDTVTFENCSFSGCSVNSDGDADGQGGAVYTNDANAAFYGCTFTTNSSNNFGGALGTIKSVLLLENVTMTGNTSPRGAAVYLGNNCRCTLNNSSITGNITTNSYGAFLSDAIDTVITLTGNVVINDNINTAEGTYFPVVGVGMQLRKHEQVILSDLGADANILLWCDGSHNDYPLRAAASSIFSVEAGSLNAGQIRVHYGKSASNHTDKGTVYLVDNVPTYCDHTSGDWIYADEANHSRTCNCGMVTETVAHAYESTVTTPPTCEAVGEETHACICGYSYTTEVDALGHTEITDEAVAATCTTTGLTEGKHCSVCGEVLVAQEEVAATGHSYTNYESNGDATCTADGTKTAECDNGCGETSTIADEGSKLEHTFVDGSCSCGEADPNFDPNAGNEGGEGEGETTEPSTDPSEDTEPAA